MKTELETCFKCGLKHTHQTGCPNSGLPNYQKNSTIDQAESKNENHSHASVEPKKLNISKRRAKCLQCKNTTESYSGLAFFEAQPDKNFDSYYCGCYGWD